MKEQYIADVLRLTNDFRVKNGLKPLTANDELNATAEAHSKDMAEQDYFSHTGKDGSKPWDRAETFGYEANSMGENIAAGQRTPEQVVQGWLDSPGHRANILNPSYTELGVGYHLLENDTGSVNYQRYWTQVFGSGDRNPASNLPGSKSTLDPDPVPAPKSEPTPEPLPQPAPTPAPPSTESPSSNLIDINGTDGRDRLQGTALDEMIQGFKDRDSLKGGAGNDTLMGGQDSDWLKGDAGNDRLIGADLDTKGRGERDKLIGGDGADIFVLGDETAAYYDDGRSDTSGWRDVAVVKDFNAAAGDVLQLHGGQEDYRLGMLSQSGSTGVFLTGGDRDELIAVVRNGGELSLDSDAVTFVG
ncbi:MAG: CAP domain-containing protein [Elainellaceae cyanobacterium]